MRFPQILKTCLFLGFLAAGLTFLSAGAAYAVADLNVAVTDGGTSLQGATLSVTMPDGTTQTYHDDDNDGRFAVVLGSSGRYRVTITTADGRSTSTSFRAPEDGTVRVDYDVSAGSPSVQVTNNSSRGGHDGGWSANFLGTFGFTDWQGQDINGTSVSEGETGKLRKYGIGGGFRYDIPDYPLFLMANFFYHPHNRSKEQFSNGGSFDLEMQERWKMQFLLGWTFMTRPKFAWALMVGLTLAQVQMNIFSGSSLLHEEKEVQTAPAFGTEMQFGLDNVGRWFFVLGATASIMNSISHEFAPTQFIRADNDLQWDTYAGVRVRF